jgi:large subunit ribosomal protein L9
MSYELKTMNIGKDNGMKVLLCEDVRSLGWLGDIVEVNDGYARNYLLPQGLAKVATEANVRAIADEKARRSEQRIHDRKRLEEAAKKVEGAEVVLAAKANEQGVLFGSIAAEAIAQNLRGQGFEVADEVVQLPSHIKQVGTHTVKLEFDKDLTAQVTVVVVPEGGVAASVPFGSAKDDSAEPQAQGDEAASEDAQQASPEEKK